MSGVFVKNTNAENGIFHQSLTYIEILFLVCHHILMRMKIPDKEGEDQSSRGLDHAFNTGLYNTVC